MKNVASALGYPPPAGIEASTTVKAPGKNQTSLYRHFNRFIRLIRGLWRMVVEVGVDRHVF